MSAGPAGSPAPMSVARTVSRLGAQQTPAGSFMVTPGMSLGFDPSQMPSTALRPGVSSAGPTPLTRPELGYYIGFRQPLSTGRRASIATATSESMLISEDADGEAEQTYVWGTNLSVSRIQSRFNAFIRTFRESSDEIEPKYMQLLTETRARGEEYFNIDGQHIYDFDRTLYNWAVTYPAETVPIFDGQLAAIAAANEGCDPEECPIQSRIYNLQETRVIRDLNPSDINKLVSVSGMVTRASAVVPDQNLALFKCTRCGNETVEWNDRGRIAEPAKCLNPACAARGTVAMIYNRCCFLDKQLVKMQEAPNDIPEGETPHTVSLFARQDLVDAAKPGDRVMVTGVYRAQGVRVNPRTRELKSVYKTYLDVVHIAKEETTNLFSLLGDNEDEENQVPSLIAATPMHSQQDGDNNTQRQQQQQQYHQQQEEPNLVSGNLTREQAAAKRAQFAELAADPAIYDRLAASVAPSIWQLDDVKRGILCQLFGGVSKDLPGAKTRGEINILLVGDPGVSKSQILGYVHKLAPRGIYTSGKGSSAVGLTAYVTKDPETKEMVLESGALVLSDRGVCCIDEFDKMSEAARSMLHEAMEQQTISVAKAGIIATLNSRTSVLASANPVGSRYNPQLSVVENIQLPPSLMSRFDLIYLLLDKANEASDRRLARHLVSLYGELGGTGINTSHLAPIDPGILREYIAYARAACKPKLTPETASRLAAAYGDMRSQGMSRKVVSATPRQLESLIRLSEALARMRLSALISIRDVDEAVRLMTVAMQQSSIDPRTGQVDMDLITTGVSAADRSAKAALIDELKKVLNSKAGHGSGGGGGGGGGVRLADLLDEMNGIAAGVGGIVTERELRLALNEMEETVRVHQGIVSLRV
jgi:DNA replication licensing factor MCM4